MLWWQTGVIYQIYPRSFKDTTGNGVGDLQGIIEKLDYITDTLGVDAVWISPFYPSPMADFGYDVSDYTDIHPLFGDLETFDELVARAHQKDLKIIIDYVPNHTSDQHPWFKESRSSRDNPRRDWYVWVDPKPDGSPPNNWQSVFGGSAWEWDEKTEQYYLHSFLKEQPDLNWRNPEVKAAMFDAVRFWLERGVDGFRIDVAHYIMKDPQMRDNPPNPSPKSVPYKPPREYDYQFHLYDKGHPDVHRVYREFRQILDSYSEDRPRFSIGEIHIYDLEEWVSYCGENLDELHMPYNFSLLMARWQAQDVRQAVDAMEASLPPGAWPNYVLGNHDEDRLASRIGRAQARVAAMLLLTLRGTPTIYYGDEIGMQDVPIPPERQQDTYGIRVPERSRDPCRTAMQWSDAPNAGFSPPETEQLWLPLAEDYASVNVQKQLEQHTSMLDLYRQLLAYRRSTPALQHGDYQPIDQTTGECLVYLRQVSDQTPILVALNFSSEEQHLRLAQFGSGRLVISTHLDRNGAIDLADLELRPDEGLIIELE
ncbi:MAG TPA: alpha-amylase family glycosyl hydrolase [Anaerolineales bacterium]